MEDEPVINNRPLFLHADLLNRVEDDDSNDSWVFPGIKAQIK
jgi:hypothetical protein